MSLKQGKIKMYKDSFFEIKYKCFGEKFLSLNSNIHDSRQILNCDR